MAPAELQPLFSADDESQVPITDAPFLQISDLTVRAGGRLLLDDVSMTVNAGELVGLVGHSGTGKSVLLRLISGLLKPNAPQFEISGSIRLQGKEILERGERPPVGVVFQRFALFDELSVEQNLAFAVDHRRERATPPDRQAVEKLSHQLGIDDLPRVAYCSVGQQQRVALVRALAYDADLIVYDEPTSGLDPRTSQEVVQLIRQTALEQGKTALVVTHDYKDFIPVADRIVLLDSRQKKLKQLAPDELTAYMEQAQEEPSTPPPGEPDDSARAPSWIRKAGAATGWSAIAVLWRSGRLIEELLLGLWHLLPRWRSLRWGSRYLLHYLRLTSFLPTLLYVSAAGMIAGFAATYFTFRFFPYQQYTQPLVMDDILASMGFALYRIVVPVIVSILLAARCGAAIASDVGSRCYTNALDAMRSMEAPPRRYLLTNVLWAMMIGTPLMVLAAFFLAKMVSLLTFAALFPDHSVFFWDREFHSLLRGSGTLYLGSGWLLAKTVACGYVIGVRGYFRGADPKASVHDVNQAISSTIISSTLLVLLIHAIFALAEFQEPMI